MSDAAEFGSEGLVAAGAWVVVLVVGHVVFDRFDDIVKGSAFLRFKLLNASLELVECFAGAAVVGFDFIDQLAGKAVGNQVALVEPALID